MSLNDVDNNHPAAVARRSGIVPRLELVVTIVNCGQDARPGTAYRRVVLPLTEAQSCALFHTVGEEVQMARAWLRTREET